MSAIIKNIARVSALKADVDTINTNLTDNYATIAYTNDKVGSIDFTPVNTQITEIKNTIGSNFDATNNTISAVIGSGYNSTNTVKASVDLVRSDVDLVRSDHDADITGINTQITGINTQITGINTQITGIKDKTDLLVENGGNLETNTNLKVTGRLEATENILSEKNIIGYGTI